MIDGWLFISDQHLPIIDAGTFYKYWLKKEGKLVKNIILYEVSYEKDVTVEKYGIDKEVFAKFDYNFSNRDLEVIGSYLMMKVNEDFKIYLQIPKSPF